MKRVLLIILILTTFTCYAQEQRDSISGASYKNAYDVLKNEYDKLVIEKVAFVDSITTLKMQVDGLHKALRERAADSNELKRSQDIFKRDLDQCSSELQGVKEAKSLLEEELNDRNIKLENIATNFLYIPYEDFSIQKVALPAIESLNDNYSSAEIRIKADLIKHYRDDIKSLLEFFMSTYKQPVFNADNEFQENLSAFERLKLIRRYEGYEDYKNTFIGKIIEEVRKPLRRLSKEGLRSGEEGPNFNRTIAILEDCVKTIQN